VVGSPYPSGHSELVTGPSIRLAGEELVRLKIPEIPGKKYASVGESPTCSYTMTYGGFVLGACSFRMSLDDDRVSLAFRILHARIVRSG
jgi:hypothetical protein